MRRVLLVEDADLARHALHGALTTAGYEVVAVRTLAEGRAALAAAPRFDLVLANVVLPDGAGFELTRVAEKAGSKSLLMTGHPDQMLALDGAVSYLAKPFRTRELIERVSSLLQP